jgi:hypothetical protein
MNFKFISFRVPEMLYFLHLLLERHQQAELGAAADSGLPI